MTKDANISSVILNRIIYISVVSLLFSNVVFGQGHNRINHVNCEDHTISICKDKAEKTFYELPKNKEFVNSFNSKFNINYDYFIELNKNDVPLFVSYTSSEVCYGNRKQSEIGNIILEVVEKFRDNYRFDDKPLFEDEYRKQISKYETIIKKSKDDDGSPKTAACLNADFEMGDYTGWTRQCGTVNNALGGVNNVNNGGACDAQHAIVTGGNDIRSGAPRVFQGGASALLGDLTNTGSQYSRLVKTFTVSATNPSITYSYMAVLQDPGGGHNDGERPYFSARLIVAGANEPCAEYFSFFGDGQPGWIPFAGGRYRDWTSVFVPLDAYIGMNVTLEVTVGDCSASGHYGYAYLDVSCGNMEIEQFCEGTATVLQAPSEGIQSYLWSTGETTSSIRVTTPGTYTVTVTPIGSTCSALLTYNATIYPTPSASFTFDHPSICVGGDIEFTNTSTAQPGSTISGYQWGYADGISTPNGLGAITGVPQTSGTYDLNSHIFNTLGLHDVMLIVETTDGCTDTVTHTINVVEGPEATIAGDNVVCANSASPVITFTGSVTPGPFTFTYNINGGPDQYVTSPAGSTTATVPVPTTIPGTYTYNLTYIVDPSTPMCEQPQNGSAVVLVNPLPTATIGTTATVCEGDAEPIVTFTGANGTSDYSFTYTLNSGAPQTISTAGSTTATISIPTVVAGTFDYLLTNVLDIATGCNQAVSAPGNSALIIVNPMPDAVISGATVVCRNDVQPVITFTGSNSTGSYTFTYRINNGINQTITTVGGSNFATVNVPTNVVGTFTYELIRVTDPITGCTQLINGSQSVVVNPLPTAVISGATEVCQDGVSPLVTFTGIGGAPGSDYTFRYTINGGAPQVVSTSGSNSITVAVPTAVATSYTYNLLSVTDIVTGCMQNQVGTVIVRINPTPTASTNGSVEVCQNATAPLVTFTGNNSSANYTFSYTINGGPVQVVNSSVGLNSTTVSQATNIPGTFIYELINVMDPITTCNSTLSLIETVIVRPLPVANISLPVRGCYFDTTLPEVDFTGSNGTNPYTFTYNINGGSNQFATSTGNSVTLQHLTNVVGTFVYTITHIEEGGLLGCEQNQNVSTIVTINNLPIIDAGDDFPICAGQPIILTGKGAQTYVWDNGVVNGQPFIPSTIGNTTYTVIGTDHNGCRNTDQITIDVIPIPIMDISGLNLYGCQPLEPIFTNNSIGNLAKCTWYLGNGEVVDNCGTFSSVFPNVGCFDVTLEVETPEGCKNSLTLKDYVCVEGTPYAQFTPKPAELSTYDWESQMVNTTIGATNYSWNFGDGTANSSLHSPTHKFPNETEGSYLVTLVASTNAGCVDTAIAIINVKEELLFYVPNTFTPNDDKNNQVFKPVFSTGFDPQAYTMFIFNRWGEMVFETHNVDIGWGGKYGIDGKDCQDGTYTWKIELKRRSSNDKKEYVGHVNLLR